MADRLLGNRTKARLRFYHAHGTADVFITSRAIASCSAARCTSTAFASISLASSIMDAGIEMAELDARLLPCGWCGWCETYCFGAMWTTNLPCASTDADGGVGSAEASEDAGEEPVESEPDMGDGGVVGGEGYGYETVRGGGLTSDVIDDAADKECTGFAGEDGCGLTAAPS